LGSPASRLLQTLRRALMRQIAPINKWHGTDRAFCVGV
jgi:hypothetical protein